MAYGSIFFILSGKLFQKKGAQYEKDLSPYDLVMSLGTHRRDLELERKILSGLYGVNNSVR